MAQVDPPETTKLTGRHAPCCHAVAAIFTGVRSVNVCGLTVTILSDSAADPP